MPPKTKKKKEEEEQVKVVKLGIAEELIRANLRRSPMYSGQIESVGPRYCPSIEDKIVKFAERLTSKNVDRIFEGFDVIVDATHTGILKPDARAYAAVTTALGLPWRIASNSSHEEMHVKFGRLGIPTILFGPGSIDQAHAAVEYVECSQVEEALRFYTEVARRFV